MSEKLVPFAEAYPAPWRMEGGEVIDAGGTSIMHFDGNDVREAIFVGGIIDAVNGVARVLKAARAD